MCNVDTVKILHTYLNLGLLKIPVFICKSFGGIMIPTKQPHQHFLYIHQQYLTSPTEQCSFI